MWNQLASSDLLVLWRDWCQGITWLIAIVYLISGVQDLIYDIWSYGWRLYRRIHFRHRERLTLARLRLRDQQTIAVFIPAWSEADVIDKMVENILHRVEYRNYIIFVGTYPNDSATQRAVDIIAAAHQRVVKVVTSHPGPTNKADCLNHLVRAMKAYEQSNGMVFDIVVMHDAEDVVHPYSFLIYNYLLPRVDVVQLPILPLPVPFSKWVHWIYADEFSENHMKDVMVRERMNGFVPFAGVGTGFSRRTITALETEGNGTIFNELSLTEDYSVAKKVRDAGLKSIFLNLLLADDASPWYTPLCKRPGFIANWSYFPFDFIRSVRQKTRWIIGIALQEWEHSGWKGDWVMKENLIKDRKGFVSAATVMLGYSILCYVVIALLGEHGFLPFKWLPIFAQGTALYDLIVIDTCFMFLRLLQRIILVSWVYGLAAGLLAIPRLFYGNIINGLASYHAIKIYLQNWQVRVMRWDKTEHQEGVGALPVEMAPMTAPAQGSTSCIDFAHVLNSADVWEIIAALQTLRPDCSINDRTMICLIVRTFARHDNHHIRAVTARVAGTLNWPELMPHIRELLFDEDWVVRSNAARTLVQSSSLLGHLPLIFQRSDRYTWEVLIRTIEQYEPAYEQLLAHLDDRTLDSCREVILAQSARLSESYRRLKTTENPETPLPPVVLHEPVLVASLQRQHEPPPARPRPKAKPLNDLFLKNAYRILGLPSTANQEAIQASSEALLRAVSASQTVSTTWDIACLPPPERTEVSIQDAVAFLENPIHRLCERLCWFHQGDKVLAQLSPSSSSIIAADWVRSGNPVRQHDGALFNLLRAQLWDPRLQYELRWTQALKYWQRVLASNEYWDYFITLECDAGFHIPVDAAMIHDFRRHAFELVMEGLNREAERGLAERDPETIARVERIVQNLELSPELFPIINGRSILAIH